MTKAIGFVTNCNFFLELTDIQTLSLLKLSLFQTINLYILQAPILETLDCSLYKEAGLQIYIEFALNG